MHIGFRENKEAWKWASHVIQNKTAELMPKVTHPSLRQDDVTKVVSLLSGHPERGMNMNNDKAYVAAYHRQSQTFAEVMRAKTIEDAQKAVVNCDIDVAEIFERNGDVMPFPKEAQKKSPRDSSLESDT